MTPREVLDNRRAAQLEIRVIEKQIENCMSDGRPMEYPATKQPEKVKGVDKFVTPLPGTNNPDAAALQHEDSYRAKLEELRREKRHLFLLAETIIESLADGEARAILRYYYCLGWTDEAIAEEIGRRDDRAVCRRRNSAVDWLENNFEERAQTTHKAIV